MSTSIYFDHEAALEYLMSTHVDEPRISAQNLLNDEGYCECCGVDFTGLDRDTLDEDRQTSLDPHPWTPGLDGDDPEAAEGRVDFDDDEGRTVLTVRVTSNGSGYIVHLDQLNDLDNVIIVHRNE